MRPQNLIFSFIILFGFNSYSQISLNISTLTKKQDVEIRNYSESRLTENYFWNGKGSFNDFIKESDSLVLLVGSCIPLVIKNLSKSNLDKIEIEIPIIPEYFFGDTIIEDVRRKRRFSKKTSNERIVHTPNNSERLDSIPQEITIKVNQKNLIGQMVRQKEIFISEAHSKRSDFSWLIEGVTATYVFEWK